MPMEVSEREVATASFGDAGANWDGLERVLSEHALADMAAKVQHLQSLTSFLSCVATTMSFSTEHHSVSAWVGASQVCLRNYEVLHLHELVIRELKNLTFFLYEPSWTSNKQMDESADVNYSRILNLEIVSLTLRCCLRILPVVDCFDKSASLASTKMLDGIILQLCSPSKLFNILGLAAPDGMHSGGNCKTVQDDEDGTWFETSGAHDMTQFSDSASLQYASRQASLLAMDSRHQKELIFAILEVYMDEFLLHPDLIARFMSSRENKSWQLEQEQVSCGVRHIEASLEAAFVHVLLSLHALAVPQSHRTRRTGPPVCNLSLPAGLILLEDFSGQEISSFYFAHIVHLLAKILNDTSSLDVSQVDELTRRRRQNVSRNCQAGGVDWSYCSQERLPNCDLKDARLYTTVSHSETTLKVGSAILEHAMLMYMRFYLPSDTCCDETGSTLYQKLECSVLKLSLSKYITLFDIFREKVELNDTDRISQSDVTRIKRSDECQCCASEILNFQGDFHREDGNGLSGYEGDRPHFDVNPCSDCTKRRSNVVFKNENIHDGLDVVAALLQLMSCAVECIGREISKLTWLPYLFGDQPTNGRPVPAKESYEADFDKNLHCVGLFLSSCIPPTISPCSKCEDPGCGRATEDCHDSGPVAYGQGPLYEFAGQAIIFFADNLRVAVQKGAPDGQLEEYFHLLESLVALLLVLDERNSRHFYLEGGLGSNCMLSNNMGKTSLGSLGCEKCRTCYPHVNNVQQLPQENTNSRFLEETVLSLQGMLGDLSEQQRPMPEFLLFFLFKQVSKQDGLSLVAMVFNSFLQSHLDAQQTVIHSTEVFWSGGLLTQMMHVALSEPTRSSSLLTFIVYMVDILQDLRPITALLSLSEISEPIFWYEIIAHSLTLASQLAVSEQRIFFRNGREHSRSLISKMCEGIERLLAEAMAAAHWLSDLSKAMSESAWHELTRVCDATGTSMFAGPNLLGEALNKAENVSKCNSFLGQADMLRKAVEDLANRGKSSFDSELISVLEKGRTFFVALLGLLAGKKLPGSQWSAYLSPHSQRRCSGPELGSHALVNSASSDPNPRCDCRDDQEEDVQQNLDQNEEIQECGRTPASDRSSTVDRTFQTSKGSFGEMTCMEQGNDLVDKPREDLLDGTELLDDDPIVRAERPLVTVEKQRTQSVPSLVMQNATEPDGMGFEKTLLASNGRKPCSPMTSAIVKRLLQSHSPMRGKSSFRSQDYDKRFAGEGEVIPQVETISVHTGFMDDTLTSEDMPALSVTNPYVDSLSGQDPSKDKFDDLKDFIVPKRGRDYSAWMKRRQKLRRRSYTKNFFRRLHEKKELLLLLDL